MKEANNELYLIWLLGKIGYTPLERPNWNTNTGTLFKTLIKIPYFYSVPNDVNRGADGLALREEFLESRRICLYLCKECTALEFLIALSIRCSDVTEDLDNTNTAPGWFGKLLHNLDINSCSNNITLNDYAIKINAVMEFVFGRKYGRDGKQGLFPLNNPEKDQRTVEIWYQMSAYILENYYKEWESHVIYEK